MILATLLLDRPASVDYGLLAKRVGEALELNLKMADILANGPIVKDGETVGLTEEQHIRVRHVRSFRPDVNETIYWLELADNPSVERPTGYFSAQSGSERKQ